MGDLRRIGNKSEDGESAAMCNQCGLLRDKVYKAVQPEFQRWKAQKMFPPCWRCGAIVGCGKACVPESSGRWGNLSCNACGAYVTRWSFVMAASPEGVSHLPESEFATYPAAWRIAYIAVHGSTHDQHWLGYARSWLLKPGDSFEIYPNFEMANRARSHFGNAPYDLEVLIKSRSQIEWDIREHFLAARRRGQVPQIGDMSRLLANGMRKMPSREPGEEG